MKLILTLILLVTVSCNQNREFYLDGKLDVQSLEFEVYGLMNDNYWNVIFLVESSNLIEVQSIKNITSLDDEKNLIVVPDTIKISKSNEKIDSNIIKDFERIFFEFEKLGIYKLKPQKTYSAAYDGGVYEIRIKSSLLEKGFIYHNPGFSKNKNEILVTKIFDLVSELKYSHFNHQELDIKIN